MNTYILPVRSDIIREIGKRGIKEFKKDENGDVKKDKNKNGSSSPFGWGTVDDTIPIHKKDLKDVRRNLASIIGQIASNFEKPPQKLPTGKRERPVEIVEQIEVKKIKVPLLLQMWHDECAKSYESGALGFIPECFHNGGMPNMDEMVQTNVGQTLLNFCEFIKRRVF